MLNLSLRYASSPVTTLRVGPVDLQAYGWLWIRVSGLRLARNSANLPPGFSSQNRNLLGSDSRLPAAGIDRHPSRLLQEVLGQLRGRRDGNLKGELAA